MNTLPPKGKATKRDAIPKARPEVVVERGFQEAPSSLVSDIVANLAARIADLIAE